MKHLYRVTYLYGRERDARLKRWQEGVGPDEFLYGMNHFDSTRFTTRYIAKDLAQWTWSRYLWEPIERVISWWLQMGFSLPVIVDEWRSLQKSDVIVSTVDAVGLPLALTKYLRILRPPLVYMSQGLSDRLSALPSRSIARWVVTQLYGRFLQHADQILVLGEGAVGPLQKAFKKYDLKVASVPFGVDADFWSPGPALTDQSKHYLVSVGSDKGRDYPTLLRAAAQLPYHLNIVTFQKLPVEILTSAMRVGSDYTDLELRQLYREADLVIIPLRDVAQPSGQSATLQAMACGKAVILTRTQGLWEPEHMRHEDNCYLVPPGDSLALQAAIARLQRDDALRHHIGTRARQTVLERYSSRQFGAKLQAYVEAILAVTS